MVMDSFAVMKWAHRLKTGFAMAALLALSACGGLSFPATSDAPRAINRPSADLFINATAVRVGRGDTVYSVARRHKLSPRALIDANNLRPPYVLSVGQRLVLPRGRLHTVRRGEYLASIARRYNVDVFAIARINGVRAPYTIYPGQKLRIPRGGGGVESTRVSTAAPSRAISTTRAAKAATAPTANRQTASVPTRTRVPAPPKRRGGKFAWPVRGKIISTFGGKDKGLFNDGINIAVAEGTAVRASENGVVAYAGNEIRGFGNLLLIKHSGGWVSAYAHNSQLLVKRGDKVKRGQVISKAGRTGSVSQAQVHFELRKGSRAVNPQKYMN